MNLKNLTLAVIVLAALAGVAAFLNRPTPPPDADPRVDQPLLTTDLANAIKSLTLAQNGNSVTITRSADADTWRVSNYHDLPANVTKLRTFVQSLTEAKIQRVVTRDPTRAARLELGTVEIDLTTTSGETWSLDLGKNADRGGRYLRFGDADDAPAYLADFNGYVDTTPKNWTESKLVAAGRDDIAAMTLTFADASEAPLTLTRESATADWVAADLPAGKQVKAGAISTLLSTASSLRFTEAEPAGSADATDAAAHSRTLSFKTFAGEEFTITIGRRPEQTVVKAPEPANPAAAAAEMVAEAASATTPESADEVLEDLTETVPAGPTYAQVTGPASLAPLATFNDTLSFKISDYSYTSLPANREALFEDTAPPPAAPAPNAP